MPTSITAPMPAPTTGAGATATANAGLAEASSTTPKTRLSKRLMIPPILVVNAALQGTIANANKEHAADPDPDNGSGSKRTGERRARCAEQGDAKHDLFGARHRHLSSIDRFGRGESPADRAAATGGSG